MTIKNDMSNFPSFLRSALTDTRPVQLTFKDLIDTNIASTSSFKYEPVNYPLKSTQQLNVDWSKFEHHTFFSSAEVNVNVAFDHIINGYPFDGSKIEAERFFEKLSGFEKWVFDQFPSFGGQLHFSGTQVGEDPSNGYSEELGTWVETKDVAGWLYPEISKNNSGESVLNPPVGKSFTIEVQVFLPDQNNDRQIILQKQSSDLTQGFTLHVEPSTTDKAIGVFSIISGSASNFVQADLIKGKFNHICVCLNRETGDNFLEFFVNEELISQSKKQKSIEAFNDRSSILFGSGSSFYVTGTLISPLQTLSGTLDELRIFHSYRTLKQQSLYSSKGLYASDSLKLYYRFNEPPVDFSTNVNDVVNAIILDSSGNSLHGTIINFDKSLRLSSIDDVNSNMVNEKNDFKKILFPLHPDIVSLNSNLLVSASLYDQENPNLITKLVPRHYLREGALDEGYSNTSVEGDIGEEYSGQGIPGQGQIGSSQVMLTFLYIWAKFFDEMKMFADAFKTLKSIDYSLTETIPDNFLNDFIRSYGFYLPPLFNNSNIQQYIEGEDISEVGLSDYSLKYVQTQILRRVLVNMPDILRSKGTQHSIRSFLRSVGIDPDNSLRIREFGGPSLRQLGNTRQKTTEIDVMANITSTSVITSPPLFAERVEPGYPFAIGPFVNGASSNINDRLLTSGSWTYEAIYKIPSSLKSDTQSLARLEVTGSSLSSQTGLLVNLVSSDSSLYAFFRPGYDSNSPTLQLALNVNIADNEKWNLSFGCNRNDSINSNVSSSYFLRAASQTGGDIHEFYTTSSYFEEDPSGLGNAFRLLNPALNSSGSILAIGNSTNISAGGMGYNFLNSTVDVGDVARTSNFIGNVSRVRFWSKGLTEEEWREHVKNYKSVGVDDPLKNYNYVKNVSGSFERLRLSSIEKQKEKFSDSTGEILLIDFSENQLHLTGSNFDPNSRVLIGELFDRSYISPYFDEYSTSEKIRIRGFQNEEYLNDAPWAILGPATEIPAGEIPLDDPRLSIEFSLVDSLNKDIINIFASLDEIATAIGSPELAYSPDYPDLQKLREIYFNRLSEKLNFKSFFEFYRWFDLSISKFIEQLVPRKTRFKGTNFVIESHMLERHKIEYQSSEIYLGDSTRSRLKDTLLVQQISGKISRY